MMNRFHIYALAASIMLASCKPDDNPPPNPPPQNSVTVRGEEVAIESLRYEMTEVIYPPDGVTEETVALRVALEGAGLTVDLPPRLFGRKISLTSRNSSPRLGSLYYMFTFTTHDDGDDDYFDRLYYRIQSWVDIETKNNDCAGWFTIDRGDGSDRWIFEWELTNKKTKEIISTGYINDVFEEIARPTP